MGNNILFRICFGVVWMPLLLPNSGCTAPLTSVVEADPHSGKLVRVTLPAGPARTAADPVISAAVDQVASEHALPPELIRSVIQTESNYNPFAVSPKGAIGIMQLIPETARRFGVSNAFNPVENIRGGAKYLKYLLDLYHGDYRLALAAYNAGEGAVAKHGGVPPYAETQKYVEKVGGRMAAAMKTRAAKQVSESAGNRTAGAPEATGQEYNRIQEIVEPDGSVRYVSR